MSMPRITPCLYCGSPPNAGPGAFDAAAPAGEPNETDEPIAVWLSNDDGRFDWDFEINGDHPPDATIVVAKRTKFVMTDDGWRPSHLPTGETPFSIRDAWRAAITLANNICVQESDRINDDDGPTEAIHMASECARRIRGHLEPTDDQLDEMLAEATGKPLPAKREGQS